VVRVWPVCERLINKSEVHVYASLSISEFYARQPYFLTLLDSDELETVRRFKIEKIKDNYIVAHGLLREALANYVHKAPEQLIFCKNEFGKPSLMDYPDLSFNMSHSADSLVIAVAQKCQLGIDVENYKQRDNLEGLVKKCFAPEEANYWQGLDKNEQAKAFYQFWVKKEAFVKADGKGITLGLNQCVINPNDLSYFLRVPESCGNADQWRIYSFSLSPETMLAVVLDKLEAELQFKRFNTELSKDFQPPITIIN